MLRTMAALLAFALTAAADTTAPTVEGNYTVDGKAMPLVDVIATPDFIAGTKVLLATQPFNRARLPRATLPPPVRPACVRRVSAGRVPTAALPHVRERHDQRGRKVELNLPH